MKQEPAKESNQNKPKAQENITFHKVSKRPAAVIISLLSQHTEVLQDLQFQLSVVSFKALALVIPGPVS